MWYKNKPQPKLEGEPPSFPIIYSMTNAGGYIKMAKNPNFAKLQIPPFWIWNSSMQTPIEKLKEKNYKFCKKLFNVVGLRFVVKYPLHV